VPAEPSRRARRLLVFALLVAAGAGGTAEAAPVEVCGLPLVAPATAGLDAAALEATGSSLDAFVASGDIAGYLALVTRGREVVWRHADGMSDLAAARPVDDRTIFRLASLTKPIVSVAALTLVDDGTLSLDDPVSRLLPAFARAAVQTDAGLVPPVRAVTVRDLLAHTAGIDLPGTASAEALGEATDLADLVGRLARAPLLHQPGEGWTYGLATDVLARVAEVASGLPLDRLIAERVTGPLGLASTRFRADLPDGAPLAVLYARRDGGLTPIEDRPAGDGSGAPGCATRGCRR
jgi:CubicO group peptidase (beta-lactamase class C family)